MIAGNAHPVDYVVDRFQDYEFDAPLMQSMRGSLIGPSFRDRMGMDSGKPIELTLNDGRRMNIVLAGTKGDFRGTGPVGPPVRLRRFGPHGRSRRGSE